MESTGTMYRAVLLGVLLGFLLIAPAVSAAEGSVSTEVHNMPFGSSVPAYASNGRGRGQEDWRTRERYDQWRNLSPSEKEMYRRRMDQYRQMSPQDRQRYQQRYQQYRSLSPEEQEQLHRKLDRWPTLPQDEKQRIRNRFAP
ncbi:MAG: DUF3106 domain-containing protein [Thermodesulfobacteriota bacterium]